MSLIVDLVIIAAAIGCIYFCISRGFVRSVMGFVSILVAIVVAFLFSSKLAVWIDESYLRKCTTHIAVNAIDSIVSAGTDKIDISKVLADSPDTIAEFASRFGFTAEELQEYYKEALTDLSTAAATDKLAEYIARPTSKAISFATAAIVLYLGTLLALKLLTFMIDLICHLPILDTLNTILGALFGIGSALLMAWMISNLSILLINALEAVKPEIFNPAVIDSSIILRFFYEHSLLLFRVKF